MLLENMCFTYFNYFFLSSFKALLKLIGQLRDKLFQVHKEKTELEDRLREELCNEFSQQVVEIENSWK